MVANNQPLAAPPVQEIIITMTPDGGVHLEGNVTNLVIAMGMFETAKGQFQSWFNKMAENRPSPESGIVAAGAQDLKEIDRASKGR